MTLTTGNDQNLIEKAILDAVRKDTEYAFEYLKKELLERLDRERDTIIAGVVLNVSKLVNYQTIGENLVITVRKESTHRGEE